MSHTPYVGICEFAASRKLHAAATSLSSGSGSPKSLVSSSNDLENGVQLSGFDCVGEDKSTMFLSYAGPLPIHPRWYDLPLGICRRGDLSQAPTRGEEHDASNAARLHKETLRDDSLEFGDIDSAMHMPTKHERKMANRVAAIEAEDVEKVARIDAREYERRTWKAYNRSIRKAPANAS